MIAYRPKLDWQRPTTMHAAIHLHYQQHASAVARRSAVVPPIAFLWPSCDLSRVSCLVEDGLRWDQRQRLHEGHHLVWSNASR